MLRSLIVGARALLCPSRRNAQIEAELESFFESSMQEKVQRGMSPENARRAAQIEIGSREMVRHRVWSAGWESGVDSMARELRFAVRRLRNSPGFAVTAVLMLAFGIGSTTAIFSIVDGVLLRPLPFADPSRLVTLGDQLAGTHWGEHDPGPVTAPEVITYQRETRAFQSLGGFVNAGYELSGNGEPSHIVAARMTPSVFTVLGIAPLLGRVFTAQDDQQKVQVAVLSYATWKSRFNENAHVLGSKILLDRKPYVVIGVMPYRFEFPLVAGHLNHTELWIPMSFSVEELSPRRGWYLGMVGRLKPGVSAEQAEEDANRVAAQIMRSYPPAMANFRIHPVVYPLHQITVLEARPLLRMFFLAVVVVLLIACANLSGLLLVRAIRRQREAALRLALGAPAHNLLRQVMSESSIISLTGGLIGVGFAALAIHIGRYLLPDTLPLVDSVSLNWTVVGFALALALLTGVFCGLAPGFAALHTNVNDALKEGGRSGSTSGSHARLREVLVVLEISIALVLLTTAGLLLRSFRAMSEVNLGFRPDHITIASYALPRKQYSTQAQIDMFIGLLRSRTPWMTIVGEIGDVKSGRPDADADEQFYFPAVQFKRAVNGSPMALSGNDGYVVMRSVLPPKQMENSLRAVVGSLDPLLALDRVQTMDDAVAQSEAPRRFNTIVISTFALTAVLLAVVGIYSIIAFSVTSRMREMAIRMALGSQRSDIIRLVLISGTKLALIGVLLGLAGAMAASSLVRAFLFQVSPFDPGVMALAALVVLTLALVASALPARRATVVDPIQALRAE